MVLPCKEIAQNIENASKITGKDYFVISRGDSTMRGHYPLETEVLNNTIAEISGAKSDGDFAYESRVSCPNI